MQWIMADSGNVFCYGATIETGLNVIKGRMDLDRDLVVTVNDFRCLTRTGQFRDQDTSQQLVA